MKPALHSDNKKQLTDKFNKKATDIIGALEFEMDDIDGAANKLSEAIRIIWIKSLNDQDIRRLSGYGPQAQLMGGSRDLNPFTINDELIQQCKRAGEKMDNCVDSCCSGCANCCADTYYHPTCIYININGSTNIFFPCGNNDNADGEACLFMVGIILAFCSCFAAVRSAVFLGEQEEPLALKVVKVLIALAAVAAGTVYLVYKTASQWHSFFEGLLPDRSAAGSTALLSFVYISFALIACAALTCGFAAIKCTNQSGDEEAPLLEKSASLLPYADQLATNAGQDVKRLIAQLNSTSLPGFLKSDAYHEVVCEYLRLLDQQLCQANAAAKIAPGIYAAPKTPEQIGREEIEKQVWQEFQSSKRQ